ncbi:geranylgeranyl reductase family protein [Methanothermococcus okinawensis]|uniref:Geranylgeranyl reductase n=1 Tax=Methanothermococcus okinawensis (strain DSM 14208 / JCM 11175 / IH1) TaxID=647113 RepID=F8AMY4_METOI|nr:geranylgeranyl reductase family protein [Methanothermococcus okinawensis]AEH06107.1 geranylgeranyl reductase [Methanothermococcus okinawensis IH1]
MDFEKYDVVIIGGGPVGCITGEHIKNHKVLIVEEHQTIGAPLQCAGLVSKKGVEELGNPKGAVNKIRGAYIHSKNHTVKIGNEEVRAYVFERKVMDKDIAIRASKKVDFLLKAYGRLITDKNNTINEKKNLLNFNRLNFLKRSGNKYGLSINHLRDTYKLYPKVVIGADGARSSIGKSAGIPMNREILSGAQVEVVNVDIDDDFVHVFFDKSYCKDFFMWIIPMGKDRARVGMCDSSNTYNKLLNFINNHPIASEILKNAVPVEFSVGALPIGHLKTTVKNNLMLVGDAAGQVKPLSGGGLYYGAKCAKICGKIVDEFLSNDYNINYLKKYELMWRKSIGNEIDFGLRFRSILKKMDDKKLNMFLEFVIKNNLIEYINEKGDMDNPSTILKDLFKRFLGIN